MIALGEHVRAIEVVFSEILTDKQKTLLKSKGIDFPEKDES
jgi:hypothetical protein